MNQEVISVLPSLTIAKILRVSGIKTRLVSVYETYVHPRYKKTKRREKRFLVHDPLDTTSVGDLVYIRPTRRFSKRKSAVVMSLVGSSVSGGTNS